MAFPGLDSIEDDDLFDGVLEGYLSLLKSSYTQRHSHNDELLFGLLTAFVAGLKRNKKIDPNCYLWVEEFVSEKFSKKLDALSENQMLGVLVQALMFCGSSRKQALDAVFQWCGVSEAKVRFAHDKLRERHKHLHPNNAVKNLMIFERESEAVFFFLYSDCLADFLNRQSKSFPLDFIKAEQAYRKLCQVLDNKSFDLFPRK